MRNLFPLFALFLALPLFAQNAETHGNRIYFSIGEGNTLSQVPLTLHLENPDIELTAVEAYLTLPPAATLSSGLLTSRTSSHELVEGDIEASHFVSIASPTLSPITSGSEPICTWHSDLSSLPDGIYTITVSGIFAVGVSTGPVTSYTVPEQTIELEIKDRVATTIQPIPSESTPSVIYNLKGIRLSTPQAGSINIINGKKIKL